MNNKLEKMMQMMDSKSPSQPSEKDIQAKKDVLMELLQECDSELKGRASRGLESEKAMKVSVIAKEPKALEEGLEAAQELTADMPEEEESQEEEQNPGIGLEEALQEAAQKAAEQDPAPSEDDEEEGLFQKKRNRNKED